MAKFGTLLRQFDLNAWGVCSTFSPSGNDLAMFAQDGSIHLGRSNDKVTIEFQGNHRPFISAEWKSANQLIAAGHDLCPTIFEVGDDEIKFVKKHTGKRTNTNSAFNQFKTKLELGAASTAISTVH